MQKEEEVQKEEEGQKEEKRAEGGIGTREGTEEESEERTGRVMDGEH